MMNQRIHHATRSMAMSALFLAAALCIGAQGTSVTAEVAISKSGAAKSGKADLSQVVVWLTPLDGTSLPAATGKPPQLIQRDKTFEPHVLVVRIGSTVQFPNEDPFFHNIFSMYDGKRFDLGLYEAGTTRSVRFDRPGISFLFCNIHSEMSAVVIAVDTPYYALSDRAGHLTIPNVPDGRYQMHVWYERSLPDTLTPLNRPVTISSDSRSLGTIHVTENPNFSFSHKNKYGDDYVPPPNQSYQHP